MGRWQQGRVQSWARSLDPCCPGGHGRQEDPGTPGPVAPGVLEARPRRTAHVSPSAEKRTTDRYLSPKAMSVAVRLRYVDTSLADVAPVPAPGWPKCPAGRPPRRLPYSVAAPSAEARPPQEVVRLWQGRPGEATDRRVGRLRVSLRSLEWRADWDTAVTAAAVRRLQLGRPRETHCGFASASRSNRPVAQGA